MSSLKRAAGGLSLRLRIQTRTRSAAGLLNAPRTLSGGGQNAHDPQVAVAPSPTGKAVAVWSRSDGTNDRIQAAGTIP
jgi:hypothetical protein